MRNNYYVFIMSYLYDLFIIIYNDYNIYIYIYFVIALTSQNAFQSLKSCDFRIVSHWSNLAGTLGVSLEDRKQLRTQALLHNNYGDSLQECLDIWITNSDGRATWEELYQAVEQSSRDSKCKSYIIKL